MSQYTQPIKSNHYVLAGNQMHPFERIVVSNRVDVPDLPAQEEDVRVVFKAGETQERRRFGLTLPWAALMIALAIAIMGMITLNTARQGSALRDEIAQLQNKYTAFEQERLALDERLSAARDSNFICYYASQNLGMKLALNEETIRVSAPSMRPFSSGLTADIGIASGRR